MRLRYANRQLAAEVKLLLQERPVTAMESRINDSGAPRGAVGEAPPQHTQVERIAYNGCSIIVRMLTAPDGAAAGSYEIAAYSVAAATIFEALGIRRLRAVIESGDDASGIPMALDRDWVVEMAKCEIDFLLASDF
jgi:hypothetical protein